MARRSEFTVAHAYEYDQSSTLRWISTHVWRYKRYALTTVACFVSAWIAYTQQQVLIGKAAEEIIHPVGGYTLLWITLAFLVAVFVDGGSLLFASLAGEQLGNRVATDAREELYVSLLGKSQAFHDRQRVGDIMARATDDVNQLSTMVTPGGTLMLEGVLGVVVPLATIAAIHLELLLVPLCFVACYIVTVRRYLRRLTPVSRAQRDAFGMMNAGLEETISGIAVVKASAQEVAERRKFRTHARQFRTFFVRQGSIEARYTPLLIYGFALGLTLLHALLLYRNGQVDIGAVIGVVGLMLTLRFPTTISVFAFSQVQAGIAGAQRILAILQAKTDLDENSGGFSQPVTGAITFENVSFGYGLGQQTEDGRPKTEDSRMDVTEEGQASLGLLSPVSSPPSAVLSNISFDIAPGQTVAIVGQTGSGKSTLTQLVNRTYEATEGRVLIDGVDVRDWSLTALRSQVATIEQDVFLFSRSIAENIAFGAPNATPEQVETAAREAQAHEFIAALPEGYATVVGERGFTLSGGQRQRIALARAFLSNPRILILDDSTSAIDSATEDQIQQAIRRAQQGRTTLLITHRLSQIRWADHILVLDGGRLAASGTHDDLLRRSPLYRRIFARYDVALPPLEEVGEAVEVTG